MKHCTACDRYDRTGIWGNGHVDHYDAAEVARVLAMDTETDR